MHRWNIQMKVEVKDSTQSRFEGNWKDQATNLSWGNSSLFSSRLGAQKNNRVSEFKVKNSIQTFKRVSLKPLHCVSDRKINFLHTLPMNVSWSKSIWNRVSFWKFSKTKFFGRKITSAPSGQIFAMTKSKNSAFSSPLSTIFFSLPRIRLVLKWMYMFPHHSNSV